MRWSQVLLLGAALFLPLVAGGCQLFQDDWEDDPYECGQLTKRTPAPIVSARTETKDYPTTSGSSTGMNANSSLS
jgi:hypothetical protein